MTGVQERRGESDGGEGGEALEGKKTGKERKGKEVRGKEEKEGEECDMRGLDGEKEEERLWLVEEILRRTLRREMKIKGMRERKGEGGR